MVAAGHQGDTATVTSSLTDSDPMVRQLALGAAHRSGVLTADVLRAALVDPAEDVVLRAVELAARTPVGVEVGNVLIGLLSDDRFCEAAAFALGELPLDDETRNSAGAALARQATGHDDPLARESAVAALGALGVGFEAVLAGTTDVATVRRRAVLALVAFDDERAEAALRTALEDRDWQVRQAAEDLIDPEP